MTRLALFATIALAFLGHSAYGANTGYRYDVLNVHIVPHTHDDVGWLKTVDQYLTGQNNTIQNAAVQYILDTVVDELQKDPKRRFSYVEMGFFSRWWDQQTNATQAVVKGLVKSGQLVFLNGGWCMHDEAATHYVGMVDQTTAGHRFLLDTFGVRPTIGWQIDPFGHSATQAALLSAEAGFDGLYFARIDHQDKALRSNASTLEMLWRASPSLGADSQVFTGVLYYHYGPPPGFNFDVGSNDDPIQDDVRLKDYNVKSRVDDFVRVVSEQADHYRGNHVMLTMGEDFNYADARTWFKNLDKLIHHVNADGRMNLFYSTPVEYTAAKQAAGLKWSVKTDDFFPYADGDHAYWTGYFSSRAALKRYVRISSAKLNAARQVAASRGLSQTTLESAARAVGVTQHHDAVSGTSKQHVAFDYAQRLSGANDDGDAVLTAPLGASFAPCRLANESRCAVTAGADKFTLAAYNPLPRARVAILRVPVSTADGWAVTAAADGSDVPVTVFPREALPDFIEDDETLPFMAVVRAPLPALDYASFVFARSAGVKPATRGQVVKRSVAAPSPRLRVTHRRDEMEAADKVVLSNGDVSISFSRTTGLMTSMTVASEGGVSSPLSLSFEWWWSWNGNDQNSGAYIFRPNGTETRAVVSGAPSLEIFNGSECSEARQSFATWLNVTTRLCKGETTAEVEWTVGAIPIEDGVGKEIVAVYTSGIASGDTFYTDSNGREMQKRRLNFRPSWPLNVTEPVAGNFYPVNAAAQVRDTAAALTVLTDRSQGAASLEPGQLQFMIQRRILADDGRGVGEPLNETSAITPYPNPVRKGHPLVVRGQHELVLTAADGAAAAFRPRMDARFAEPQVFLSNSEGPPQTAGRSELALPANVALMTAMPWREGQMLVRVAHQFAADEDTALSGPATVSLAAIAEALGFKATAVEEASLTGVAKINDVQRLQWEGEDGTTAPSNAPVAPLSGPAFNATLEAMEIRTFILSLA